MLSAHSYINQRCDPTRRPVPPKYLTRICWIIKTFCPIYFVHSITYRNPKSTMELSKLVDQICLMIKKVAKIVTKMVPKVRSSLAP